MIQIDSTTTPHATAAEFVAAADADFNNVVSFLIEIPLAQMIEDTVSETDTFIEERAFQNGGYFADVTYDADSVVSASTINVKVTARVVVLDDVDDEDDCNI